MTGAPSSRVAVISGGTTGIGLATARRLLSAGHKVAVFSHGDKNVTDAQQDLSDEFGTDQVLARKVDLRKPSEITAFFAEVREVWRAPEILVCNAGISPKGPNGPLAFADIALEEWNEVMSVNLTGAMLCSQACLPGMVAAGFGRVVFIGSLAGRTKPRIAGASYVASKAALAGLARSLVPQFGAYGITVNVVAPGRILTPLTGSVTSRENVEALSRIPSGRLGMPDDVASVVGFLVSDDASFVNGAIIDVNGGEFTPS
jgi:3-oxoacyl-[acyl-carrier protein] reductase